MHINYDTGRINLDFYKDGSLWYNPPTGSQAYVVNTASNVQYSLTQNPNYLYAYRTADTLPYGTYNVYVKSGANTLLHSTVTLNAANVWVRPKYFTLTYSANGADSGSLQYPNTYLSGDRKTVAGQGSLTKNGYTFTGWRTGASSGTFYAAGSTITITATTTLYAQWQPIPRASVRVLLNGSAWNACRYSMQLRNADTGATIPLYYDSSNIYVTLDPISYGNYDIYVTSQGSSTFAKTGSTFAFTQSNTSATVNYHTVSFSGNGNTGGTVPSSLNYALNVGVPVPSGSSMSKSGYTFCYWTVSEHPYTPIVAGSTYTVTGTTTLRAKWFAGNYALGDVNANGKIDTTDSQLIMSHSAELELLTGSALRRADFNDNGVVDTTDARLILQAAAGLSLLSLNDDLSVMGNVNIGQVGTDSIDWDSVLSKGETITWDDLDWSRLDMNAIDWDTFTMEELFRILLGNPSHEIM